MNARQVLATHVRAYDSDPFAGFRLNTHIRRGIIADDDFPYIMKDASYALGQRRQQATRSYKSGEFVSMRRR